MRSMSLSRLCSVPSLCMGVATILAVSSFCYAESTHKRTNASPLSQARNSNNYRMIEPLQSISDDFFKFDDVTYNESSTWVCAATTLCYESTYGSAVRPNGCCGPICCYGRDECCSSLGHCIHCSSSEKPVSGVIVGAVAAGIMGSIALAMCVGAVRRLVRWATGINTVQTVIVAIAEGTAPEPNYPVAHVTVTSQYALTGLGEDEGDIELDLASTDDDEPYRYGMVVSVGTAASLSNHRQQRVATSRSSSMAVSADASDLASACTVSSHCGASNHGDDTNAVPRAFAIPIVPS
jgi:hypothetical protein